MEIIHKTTDDAIDLLIFNKLFRIGYLRNESLLFFSMTRTGETGPDCAGNGIPILIIQKKVEIIAIFYLII